MCSSDLATAFRAVSAVDLPSFRGSDLRPIKKNHGLSRLFDNQKDRLTVLKYEYDQTPQNIPKLKNTLVIINKGNCMVRLDLDDRVVKYSSQVISCAFSTCSMEIHMQRHIKKCSLQKGHV